MWKIAQPKKVRSNQIYAEIYPPLQAGEKEYIYVVYVYECNAILTIATKNISDKETIRAFTIIK